MDEPSSTSSEKKTKAKPASTRPPPRPKHSWTVPPGAAIPADQLTARLDVFETTAVLTTYRGANAIVRHISPDELTEALTRGMDQGSGLLPTNALWWRNSSHGPVVAFWVGPQLIPVALQTKPLEAPERFRIPMPGLLFICQPSIAPWAFAVPERPTSESDPVYRIPAYNVFRDGRVCPGSHKFNSDVTQIPAEFFTSLFSRTGDYGGRSKSHPSDLEELWRGLDGQTSYPVDDLVECGTIKEVLKVP